MMETSNNHQFGHLRIPQSTSWCKENMGYLGFFFIWNHHFSDRMPYILLLFYFHYTSWVSFKLMANSSSALSYRSPSRQQWISVIKSLKVAPKVFIRFLQVFKELKWFLFFWLGSTMFSGSVVSSHVDTFILDYNLLSPFYFAAKCSFGFFVAGT